MPSFADYRAALRAPGATAPLLASVVGRFPIAMVGLASLLYVQHGYGSFAAAGFVASAMLAGIAAGAVLQGRLMDRFGPTRPLLVASGVFAASVALLVAAIEWRLGVPVLSVLALLLGLSNPALPGASRALWLSLVPEGPRREAALTYEAVSLEAFFILGPAVAAALVEAPWPGTGLAVGVTMTLVGAVSFALTKTVRNHRPARPANRPGLGALASPGMRLVAIAALGFGCAVGVIEVAVPAVTTYAGRQVLAGILFSAWSVASVLGGLLYSLNPWPRTLPMRLPALLAGFGLAVGAMGLAPGLIGLAVAMMLAGSLLAPQGAAHSIAVELTAPPGTATEAWGWIVTAETLGAAAGSAMAGALVETEGPSSALLAGGCTALALAGVLWLGRGRISSPEPQPLCR